MENGFFITLEGCEGAGKTTAARELIKRLETEGYDVVYTREPGGGLISEKIRDVILDPLHTGMDMLTETLLYAASRRQHIVEVVTPALKAGKVVICDRFTDSTLAYQGYGRYLDIENLKGINAFATDGLVPDLTLLFDITPELGLSRIAENDGREVNRLDLESLDFHKRVYAGYLKIAHEDRFEKDCIRIVDASQSLELVVANAYELIKVVLEGKYIYRLEAECETEIKKSYY